jgi:hypothetical protein
VRRICEAKHGPASVDDLAARDAALQTPTHRDFCRDYFTSGGASNIIYLDENPEAGL